MTSSIPGWRPRPVNRRAATPPSPEPASALPAHLQKRFSKSAFRLSPQQQDFLTWIAHGQGSCMLEAVAGAGKTTTLIRGLREMSGTVFFGAYNKKIADEIKAKAQESRLDRPGMFISTSHSAGFFACRKAWPQVKVSDSKNAQICAEYRDLSPAHAELFKTAEPFIKKMLSFGKQYLFGCAGYPAVEDEEAWLRIVDHFNTEEDLPSEITARDMLPWLYVMFKRSREMCSHIIDFDDMVYAPITHNLRVYQNDWVLIDECQDLNPARMRLARRMLKPNGRAVFVGDSRQAIYGFTGAGNDSVEQIIAMFGCVRLPLTVTYRCPKKVVAYVRQWVAHIEPHPDAPEGEVRSFVPAPNSKGVPWFVQERLLPTDAVLCRYTRPLLAAAYGMIKAGVPCRIEGRDIGLGLIALTARWRVTTLSRLRDRLNELLARETEKRQAAGQERLLQELSDKVGTVLVLISRCEELGKQHVTDLVAEIEQMFVDNVEGCVVLSTGHKAKGREWPRVFWLQTSDFSRPTQKEWERIQEQNVKYVIGTRAQATLVLVSEDAQKTPGAARPVAQGADNAR